LQAPEWRDLYSPMKKKRAGPAGARFSFVFSGLAGLFGGLNSTAAR